MWPVVDLKTATFILLYSCLFNSKLIIIVLFSLAPSSAPTVLNVTAISSTSIMVKYQQLSQMFANGILTGHRVSLSGKDNHFKLTNETEVTFIGLGKYTLYDVSVAACNRIGCGPTSSPISIRTMEDGKKILKFFPYTGLIPRVIIIGISCLDC